MSTHFLVLGSTGAIGQLFVKRALAQGHQLTLFARNPSKLSEDISKHDRTTIIQGELNDQAAQEKAANSGATILVSCAGPLGDDRNTPITKAYTTLLPLLTTHNFTRALILCTPSHAAPEDSFSALWGFGRWFMWLFRYAEYNEMVSVGRLVSQQCPEEIDWTLFRVGGLTDGEAGRVGATMLGSGKDKVTVSRDGVAAWVLGEAEEGKWKGKAPYVCNI